MSFTKAVYVFFIVGLLSLQVYSVEVKNGQIGHYVEISVNKSDGTDKVYLELYGDGVTDDVTYHFEFNDIKADYWFSLVRAFIASIDTDKNTRLTVTANASGYVTDVKMYAVGGI